MAMPDEAPTPGAPTATPAATAATHAGGSRVRRRSVYRIGNRAPSSTRFTASDQPELVVGVVGEPLRRHQQHRVAPPVERRRVHQPAAARAGQPAGVAEVPGLVGDEGPGWLPASSRSTTTATRKPSAPTARSVRRFTGSP